MNQDLVSWLLQHYGREQFTPDPGLHRIRSAFAELLPQLQTKRIVTIAGTNGKGETTLRLSSMLQNSSYCTWISPHITRLTERFRDEQGEIDESLLKTLIMSCHDEVRKKELRLSYYEFLFFVFCTWAARRDPEYLLLEVGLGGRMDAVNVFDAELILLPSISRDHQELLGNRYDLILAEKLALLRKNSFLLSYLHLRYLREKTGVIVQAAGAKWRDLEELGLTKSYEFSRRNHLLACAAYEYLMGNSFDGRSYECSSSDDLLEHRGEIVQNAASYVFFGSHNVDGMRKLIQFLHSDNYTFSRPPFDAVIVSFSQRDKRDLQVLFRMLKGSGLGRIVVTSFSHPKAAPVEVLEELCAQEGISFVQDIIPYVQGANKDQNFLVSGSYYFLGHFKSLLRSGR